MDQIGIFLRDAILRYDVGTRAAMSDDRRMVQPDPILPEEPRAFGERSILFALIQVRGECHPPLECFCPGIVNGESHKLEGIAKDLDLTPPHISIRLMVRTVGMRGVDDVVSMACGIGCIPRLHQGEGSGGIHALQDRAAATFGFTTTVAWAGFFGGQPHHLHPLTAFLK